MKFYFNADSNMTHFQFDVQDYHGGVTSVEGPHVIVDDLSVLDHAAIVALAASYGGDLVENKVE